MTDQQKERPMVLDLTDDEIMAIYSEGPLYHVPMHEHKDETEREEERIALLMFARDIIAYRITGVDRAGGWTDKPEEVTE